MSWLRDVAAFFKWKVHGGRRDDLAAPASHVHVCTNCDRAMRPAKQPRRHRYRYV
jgi:hypothetical protein